MNTPLSSHWVRLLGALGAFASLSAGCSTDAGQPSQAAGGRTSSTSGGAGGLGTAGTSVSSVAGTGSSVAGASTSNAGASNAGTSNAGTSNAGTSNAGAGGSVLGGAGSSSAGSAGAGSGGSGGTNAGTTPSTVELIGPGGATCGATNATHGDGFVCVLNSPSPGPNVVGYWFDYPFAADTCNLKFTKPSGNSASDPQVCFSGSACPTTSGGGLGLALCDVHGIDVSTWPELMALEAASELSSTLKSPFSGCNPGASITSVSWTVASGSIPADASVLFDDAADVDVTRVALTAGATSVSVPAGVDTSKVASLKFSISGASNATWSFCLSSLKVALR